MITRAVGLWLVLLSAGAAAAQTAQQDKVKGVIGATPAKDTSKVQGIVNQPRSVSAAPDQTKTVKKAPSSHLAQLPVEPAQPKPRKDSQLLPFAPDKPRKDSQLLPLDSKPKKPPRGRLLQAEPEGPSKTDKVRGVVDADRKAPASSTDQVDKARLGRSSTPAKPDDGSRARLKSRVQKLKKPNESSNQTTQLQPSR